MARYFGSVKGNRSEVTRFGTEKSGITGFVSGEKINIKTRVAYNRSLHSDITLITIIGDPDKYSKPEILTLITADDLQKIHEGKYVFIPAKIIDLSTGQEVRH